VSNAAGTFDISGTGSDATITTLNGVANSHVTLGGQTLTISNGSTAYAGIIQGTGGLTVTGGTQILSGANTYTGPTTISAGTLQIGNAGATGSVTGDIVDNAALVFNRTGTLTYWRRDQRHRLARQDRHKHADADGEQYLRRRHDDQRRDACRQQRRQSRCCFQRTHLRRWDAAVYCELHLEPQRDAERRRRHLQYQRCDNIDVGRHHQRRWRPQQERRRHADADGTNTYQGNTTISAERWPSAATSTSARLPAHST
jgi:autotransporter-associated beta strand protein